MESRIQQIEANSISNKENIEILKKDLENLRKVVQDIDMRLSTLEDRVRRSGEGKNNNGKILGEISRISKQVELLEQKINNLEDEVKKFKAIRTFPVSETEAVSLISQARKLLLEGEIDKSYEIIKNLYERGYSSDEARFIAGEIFFRKGDYRSAVREWLIIVQNEKSVKDKTILPRTYLRLANAFLRLGDKNSAKLMLEAIISKYPDSPESKTAKDLMQQLKSNQR